MDETRKLIKEISYSVIVDDHKDEFLKLAYTALNLYEKSSFPIKTLEKMIEEGKLIAVHPGQTIEKLNELKVYLGMYVFDSLTISKVKHIIDNLLRLRENLYETNPKWDELVKVVRATHHRKVALILYKRYFVDVLKMCFSLMNIPISFSMHTITKFNPDKTYDEIIVTGVYQGKNFDILNNSYTGKIRILAYHSETNLFAWMSRNNKHIVDIIDKRNTLVEYVAEENIVEIKVDVKNDVIDSLEIENVINEIIKRQGILDSNFNGSGSKTECVKMAIFESGEKAYFSRYFTPSLLDRDAVDIKDIKIEELSIGDELVFKKDERDMDKDIIQDIIEKLLENKEFSKEYKDSLMLSHYWKNALDKFMKETGWDEYYISAQLLNYGVVRGPMAVSTWLRSNKTTAPDKPDVYYALANILQDRIFMDKWKEICEACSAVRKLQMKLKKYLGRCIVKSVVKEAKSDFDKIVEDCVGDVAKLAQIVQIEQLYDVQIEVPVHMTNKLIEN